MLLLNGWVLFGLIPLYFIYKKSTLEQNSKKTRLLYLSLLFMFLAMSRPALDNSYVNEKFHSQDFIIALDVSYSMQADDLKPSRYEMAKAAIKKLVALHPKDRFTIFAFTSNTLLISPPTTDTAISMLALDAIKPQYILTKGTNIYKVFEAVAKTSLKEKKLIIFSDGGDEHNIAKLSEIAKKHNIIPYIVATATQKGAALKKNGRYIKDIYSSLVISRINPALKELAKATAGKYYVLNTLEEVNAVSDDIMQKSSKQESIKVKSYTELFYLPLIIAIILYLGAITRLQKFFTLAIPLIFFSHSANASIFDSKYINSAQQYYKDHNYTLAAKEFQRITPSVESYYNIATAYYKAGHYKTALNYYTQIKTKDPTIKQRIFYNMGNCAVKLRRYDRAEKLYIQALALGDDNDTLYNLNLIRKLHLKTGANLIDMLPPKNAQTKKNSSKSISKQKENKKNGGGKNNSNHNTAQSAKSGTKSKKTSKSFSKTKSIKNKSNYKVGYKAYETINKGYTNEKEPW